jgi:NADPH-dependent curcumin reductase
MNRQYLLVRRPRGDISPDDMKIVAVDKPTPVVQGEVVVQNLYVSVDPTHRVWMSDTPQYWEPSPLNEPMRANTLGIVEASLEPALPVGTYVLGFGNVQDYYVTSVDDPTTAKIHRIPGIPITAYLSVLSVIIGATAWVGIFDILNATEGEVVVITAAAGAVGSLSVQLAKMRGCVVIGIAGSDEKVLTIVETLGADAAINYKTENILERLQQLVPQGVDCFLDLVGGDISDAVMQCMNNFGRIALGGTISGYSNETSSTGMRNITLILHKRLTLQGFICSDHVEKMNDIIPQYVEWITEGRLKYSEDIVPGMENYLEALDMIMTGRNTGKVILQLAAEK